jgi:hypothetical protein
MSIIPEDWRRYLSLPLRDPVVMRARPAVVLGKAHAIVATNRRLVEMLATAGRGVDDVAG